MNNRKALRLVFATSYDFQGPILGHKYVCWLVSGSWLQGCSLATSSMSWHTVQFTMYKMAKGSDPLVFWGGDRLFFSHSQKMSCPLICKKKIGSNWEVNK